MIISPHMIMNQDLVHLQGTNTMVLRLVSLTLLVKGEELGHEHGKCLYCSKYSR